MKQIYRQVELLRQVGIEAWVMHQEPGFRVSWFNSAAPVIDLEAFKAMPLDPQRDWLVFPETWVNAIPNYLPGFRKVIFNQNAYYTFGLGGSFDPHVLNLYHHNDVKAVVTVSCDNYLLLQHALGLSQHSLHVLVNGIDPELFYPPAVKHRRIAFLPRKNPQDAGAVQLLAQHRPVLQAYSFYALENLSHQQLAKELRESLLFLNFGHPEGFGLPLAEAIASSCIVVGYDGLAGRDFCHEALNAVDFGDWLGCVDHLERAVLSFEADPQGSKQQLLSWSESLRNKYSLSNEFESCRSVWMKILQY